MVAETRKIMHLSGVKIVATTVRVPVFYAHSEAIHVELTEPMSPEEARACLRQAPGVVVQDDLSKNDYPMPLPASGRDEVFVGRNTFQAQRLHHQQAAVFKIAVADGRHDSPNNFSENHV